MREILFRGKRLDNGQWVYGGIRIVQGRYYVIPSDSNPFGFEVDPATVGQYTGATDMKGIKLFEGDIILAILDKPYYIFWDKEKAGFALKNSRDYCLKFYPCNTGEDTIIGNIHDNPEWKKGGEE